MLIYLLKFLHVVLAVTLLGITTYCMTRLTSLARYNAVSLWIIFLSLLTGTALVHARHYTFSTPWIQAAYVLVLIFCMITSALIYIEKKYTMQHPWVWRVTYAGLIGLLLIIIHDAVMKSTFTIF